MDFVLGLIILILFAAFFVIKYLYRPYMYFEELFEEVMYVIWFIWQYKRIITIFRNIAKNPRSSQPKLSFSQITEESEHDHHA